MKRSVKFLILILFLASTAYSNEQILPPNISSRWGELTDTLSLAFKKRDMPVKLAVRNNASLKAQEQSLKDSLGTSEFETELTKWTGEFETGAENEVSKIEALEQEKQELVQKRADAPDRSWFGTTRHDIDLQLEEVENSLLSRKARLNRINQAVFRELKTAINEPDDKTPNARYRKAFSSLDKQIQDSISALEIENELIRGKIINQLLDKAIEILMPEEGKNFRHKAETLNQTIRNLKFELDALQNQRVSARGKDLEKITKRIAEVEQQILMTKQLIKDIKAEMIQTLEKTNLKLTSSQRSNLFTFITGDDYLQNAAVFASVKSVMEQLASLMRTNQGNIEIENRYLGMRIVLYDILIYIYRDFITKIDELYMPQLNKILTESERVYKMSIEA